jgi:hypothetical protein
MKINNKTARKKSSERSKNGECYKLNGFTYVSVKGQPRERGFAFGKCCAKDFKDIQKMLHFVCEEEYGRSWEFFVDAGKKYLKPTIKKEFAEFFEEMEGIAEGINSAGGKTDVDEILAWNNYFTLLDSWYSTFSEDGAPAKKSEGGGGSNGGGSKDRCSAFIATGSYTKDGKIVVAHNSFSNFVDGQYMNYILDVEPEKGHRILMQTCAGWIWSGTDFFITSVGIIGTETTIGGFLPYENNYTIACRIRKAMQYGDTMDDYVKILLDGNSGDYANSWLFGDINTNEILRLELGLKYYNVERTKDGYFVGFNSTYDPQIRNLECANSGFNDVRRHQGARKVRLTDLMEQYKGKLNVNLARELIADHYDVYLLKKNNPCSRTVCSHYELDGREYMSQSDRPLPYQPRGAMDGFVTDSNLAKKMTFMGRWGASCGTPFIKKKFFDKHRQWIQYEPYLHDRPRQPWTTFKISGKEETKKAKKNKTLRKRK